ncbi:MAG: hypothetical protein EOO17_02560 [Chloroflexi bacterium]|nr:MAG: hypothetical protein EOO17_02560 [Chloroflexota bacterium]
MSLKDRYDEPWRHYHNFEHPLELFDTIEQYRSQIQRPTVLGWVALYHDAVYEPTAPHGQNEERSAQLAEAMLPSVLDSNTVDTVAAYIRATADHKVSDSDEDLDFFLDADLAILGAPSDRYDRYAADVRAEYSHVPDSLYVPARITILNELATRAGAGGLYQIQGLKDKYELRAHDNISRETAHLSTHPSRPTT